MATMLKYLLIIPKNKEVFENLEKIQSLNSKSKTKKEFEKVLKFLKTGRDFHFSLPLLALNALIFMLPISVLFLTNFGKIISLALPFFANFAILFTFITIFSISKRAEKEIIVKDTLLDNDISEVPTDNPVAQSILSNTLEQHFGNTGKVEIIRAYKANWESEDLNCPYYIHNSEYKVSEKYKDSKGNTHRRKRTYYRNIVSCELDIELPNFLIYDNEFRKIIDVINTVQSLSVGGQINKAMNRYIDKATYWKKFIKSKGMIKVAKAFGITKLDKKVASYANDERDFLKSLKPTVKKSIYEMFSKHRELILSCEGNTIHISHPTKSPDNIFETEKTTSIKTPKDFADELSKHDSADAVIYLMELVTDIKRMNDSNFN